jgi:hypothetical protein
MKLIISPLCSFIFPVGFFPCFNLWSNNHYWGPLTFNNWWNFFPLNFFLRFIWFSFPNISVQRLTIDYVLSVIILKKWLLMFHALFVLCCCPRTVPFQLDVSPCVLPLLHPPVLLRACSVWRGLRGIIGDLIPPNPLVEGINLTRPKEQLLEFCWYKFPDSW